MLATLTDATVSELFVGSAEGAEIHIHVLGTEVVFMQVGTEGKMRL